MTTIEGHTYPHRRVIAAHGGIWDKERKLWTVPADRVDELLVKLPKLSEYDPKTDTITIPSKPRAREPEAWAKVHLDEIEELRRERDALEARIESKTELLLAEATKEVKGSGIYDISWWECKDPRNAIAKCLYDVEPEDVLANDECVFCGTPRERK